MPPKERARLMILFYRKKGMSFEDFDKYWREEHSQVALELPIFKKNILKYEQVRTLAPSFFLAITFIANTILTLQIHVDRDSQKSWKKDGHQVTDYDGIVVLEAASEDKIREVFQDKEYLEKLAPNEAEFSERTSFTMMPAHVVTVLDKQE